MTGLVISKGIAEHHKWGDGCDGWHLVNREDISVIQECVLTGGGEAMNYQNTAGQFFYVLEGEAVLKKDEGIEIAPQIKHQFTNLSMDDVHFLVISVPSTGRDRVYL